MAERYKIYDQLGAGGVGAVYRAYDNELKRWVAIKRLMSAKDASGDQNTAAELRREADALASLRNPNIVTIFDVASDAEGLFLVMELLEGEDLADVVGRGPLHYDDFKELASQTLEALLAAHERHILHRDIKPENIKVERLPGGRMQSKIIDFGLARAGMRARKQTEDQAGTVMGSIFYMAPEQLTRAPVDVRTDLYALGCVFYEALSGRKAFDGESMNAVIDKHINHDIIPLNLVAPHVPPWLGAWVLRLMALNPDDRPMDAQQAIEEFRAWEKMSAAPQMMPWMPQGYGQQASPYSHTQPLYPGGHLTTGAVPVQQPGYYAQPAEEVYAQPVLEVVPDVEPIVEVAAYTTPLSRATPPPPSAAPHPHVYSSSALRQPSSRLRSSGPLQAQEEEPKSKGKLIAIIAGAVVLLGAGGWFIFGSKKSGAEGESAGSGLLNSGPQPVTYKLPDDRIFPPVDADICVHVVAGVGMLNESGSQAAPGNAVMEWHDLSPLGNDNLFRAYEKSADHAPRRLVWPTPKSGGVGPKPNRTVLDFHPRNSQPVALNLTNPADEDGKFPFGNVLQSGEPGVTLAVVFQAEASSLPCQVLTLRNDTVSMTLSVDKSRRLTALFRNGGISNTIASKDVVPTEPCTVVLTWQANGNAEMRAKDAAGQSFRGTTKVKAPAQPLTQLQIGKVANDKGGDAAPEEQFSGYLAELVLYSSVLKVDQIQLLETKVLRDHYIQGPPTSAAPPKK